MASERPAQGDSGTEKVEHHRFRERMRQGDSYGLVLAALIADFLIAPLFQGSPLGSFISLLLISGILMLGLHTSRVKRITFHFSIAAAAFNAIAAAVGFTTKANILLAVATASAALLVLITSAAVLRRIMTHPVVATETILGAVCVYIMIGIFFSFIYRFIDLVTTTSVLQGTEMTTYMRAFYFSFVTLTTTGYGDVTAATNLGRTIAVIEALIGQLFLATTIARLVATLRQPRPFIDDGSNQETSDGNGVTPAAAEA